MSCSVLLQVLPLSMAFGQVIPTGDASISAPAVGAEFPRRAVVAVAHERATSGRVHAFTSNTAALSPRQSLANSIARSARRSVIERGTQTAKEAVLDCLKGDYPGGGMGLLSLPFGRSSARTDHCVL